MSNTNGKGTKSQQPEDENANSITEIPFDDCLFLSQDEQSYLEPLLNKYLSNFSPADSIGNTITQFGNGSENSRLAEKFQSQQQVVVQNVTKATNTSVFPVSGGRINQWESSTSYNTGYEPLPHTLTQSNNSNRYSSNAIITNLAQSDEIVGTSSISAQRPLQSQQQASVDQYWTSHPHIYPQAPNPNDYSANAITTNIAQSGEIGGTSSISAQRPLQSQQQASVDQYWTSHPHIYPQAPNPNDYSANAITTNIAQSGEIGGTSSISAQRPLQSQQQASVDQYWTSHPHIYPQAPNPNDYSAIAITTNLTQSGKIDGLADQSMTPSTIAVTPAPNSTEYSAIGGNMNQCPSDTISINAHGTLQSEQQVSVDPPMTPSTIAVTQAPNTTENSAIAITTNLTQSGKIDGTNSINAHGTLQSQQQGLADQSMTPSTIAVTPAPNSTEYSAIGGNMNQCPSDTISNTAQRPLQSEQQVSVAEPMTPYTIAVTQAPNTTEYSANTIITNLGQSGQIDGTNSSTVHGTLQSQQQGLADQSLTPSTMAVTQAPNITRYSAIGGNMNQCPSGTISITAHGILQPQQQAPVNESHITIPVDGNFCTRQSSSTNGNIKTIHAHNSVINIYCTPQIPHAQGSEITSAGMFLSNDLSNIPLQTHTNNEVEPMDDSSEPSTACSMDLPNDNPDEYVSDNSNSSGDEPGIHQDNQNAVDMPTGLTIQFIEDHERPLQFFTCYEMCDLKRGYGAKNSKFKIQFTIPSEHFNNKAEYFLLFALCNKNNICTRTNSIQNLSPFSLFTKSEDKKCDLKKDPLWLPVTPNSEPIELLFYIRKEKKGRNKLETFRRKYEYIANLKLDGVSADKLDHTCTVEEADIDRNGEVCVAPLQCYIACIAYICINSEIKRISAPIYKHLCSTDIIHKIEIINSPRPNLKIIFKKDVPQHLMIGLEIRIKNLKSNKYINVDEMQKNGKEWNIYSSDSSMQTAELNIKLENKSLKYLKFTKFPPAKAKDSRGDT